MFEIFVHSIISSRLSEVYEITFQVRILEILKENKLVIDHGNNEK